MRTPATPSSPSAAGEHSGSAVDVLPERRRQTSDLELASQKLAHAVNYLVLEQLEGRRHSIPANREAIALLCHAGRTLEKVERRGSARASIAAWLRGPSLNRAHRKENDEA